MHLLVVAVRVPILICHLTWQIFGVSRLATLEVVDEVIATAHSRHVRSNIDRRDQIVVSCTGGLLLVETLGRYAEVGILRDEIIFRNGF